MSKVKIEGNASGTGTLTIAAPNTNTDRTIDIPDGDGEIVVASSGVLPALDGSNLTGISSYSDADALTLFNASGSAPVYACRAWVKFIGQGTPAINDSGNVSSITDNGTGLYTINFTTAMPDADYCFSGGGWRNSTGSAAPFVTTPTSTTNPFSTTSLSIMTSLDNATEFDLRAVTVAIHK